MENKLKFRLMTLQTLSDTSKNHIDSTEMKQSSRKKSVFTFVLFSGSTKYTDPV